MCRPTTQTSVRTIITIRSITSFFKGLGFWIIMLSFWLACLSILSFVESSHFAYGTINWIRNGDASYDYCVTVQLALRISYFRNIPAVGGTMSSSNDNSSPFIRLGYVPEGCATGCGSSCYWQPNTKLVGSDSELPPDKCSTRDKRVTLNYQTDNWSNLFVVQQIYASDDYFVIACTKNITIPNYTIGTFNARAAKWRFYMFGYARLNTLNGISMIDGNGGGNLGMQLDTILDPAFTASPMALGLPREYAAVGRLWTFDFSRQVYTISSSQLPLTYSIATGKQSGSNTVPNSGLANTLMGFQTDNPIQLTTTNFSSTGLISWYQNYWCM
jgi:hypothetical protein